MKPEVVSREEWRRRRLELLKKEKEFTHARDELTALVRALPRVKVTKDYSFETVRGKESLAELFGPRSQLAVYHFMLGPDWEDGCKSCSFWADNFNGISPHLGARDVSFVVISRAPLAKLQAFKERMGWGFEWVSSHDTDFNFDFKVSFTPEEIKAGEAEYNYQKTGSVLDEMHGASFFKKDNDGLIYHTYSMYRRGLDILNGAYHWLDHCPDGRNEGGLDFTMDWLRHHDKYGE